MLPPRPAVALLLSIYVSIYPAAVAGWNIALSISSQAGGAVGGEPFATQPVVSVNDKNGEPQTSFEGRMTVQAHTTPTGRREPVWKEGEAAASASAADFVSQDVADGRAAFSGLGIDAAGGGYRLKFVLYDEHGLIMGTAVGDEFAVSVGESFRLGFVVQPEGAFGGSVFGSQPLLAIQDRGGNAVTDVNEGTVAASFQNSPVGSTLRCAEDGGLAVPVRDGLASFEGLFVDEAGARYSLRFATDLALDGDAEATSNEFSVGVGPASEIALVDDASDGSASGGRAFAPQPRAEVRDAGGNVLVTDSSSAIRVSFYSNPSGGTLSPASGTTVRLEGGVVQFRGLSVDRAGAGYRLKYDFLQYEEEHMTYDFLQYDEGRRKETSISANGSYFDVGIGPPHRLSILRHSSGGWAGNQPFPVQPKVALLDAGGNVVLGDSTSTVTAHVTPSLAVGSRVIVDTSNDPVPSVAEVVFAQGIVDDERLSYGPGDVVRIDVAFSQEVAIFETVSGGALPQLMLNVVEGGGLSAYAELVPRQSESFSRTISFEYSVDAGHSQSELDYSSGSSLLANDYSIEDAFGRSADLILPAAGAGASLSASKAIGISDDRPVVVSVTTDLPTGEYGAGDEVNFVLSFDRHVAVAETDSAERLRGPGLPLKVESSIAVIDVSTAGAILPGSYFNVLRGGETSEPIPWDASASEVGRVLESLPGVAGGVCVSRAPSPNAASAGGFRWAVRFLGNDAAFDMEVDGAGLEFSGGGGALTANFITTDSISGDWVRDDGDASMCTARSAVYVDGSGSKQLGFNFKILPGDTSARLDISNSIGAELIFPTPEDEISLLVNSPGTSPIKVDPSIEGIGLSSDRVISIDTAPPSVASIAPQGSTTPAGTYAVGDSLFFEVSFDKPVEVDIGLELALNNNGVARYVSGSGTATLVLEYTVEEGDSTSHLDTTSLTTQNTEGGRSPVAGRVRRKSLSPTTDANLDISHIPSISDNLVIDGERPRMLSVSFDESDQGETFARGNALTILVQFSAPVVVNESSPPILGLVVGANPRWATYSSGSGSSTLRFSYVVVVGDSSMPLDLRYRRFCHEDGDCDDTEGLIARPSATLVLDADIGAGFTEEGIRIAASPENGVTIDTSLAPATTVVSAVTLKDAETYGVGEIVDIRVKFTDRVFLPGTMPILLLNTGGSASYHAGHGTDTLTFRLISTSSDSASKLDWALDSSTNSAIDCAGACIIENANGIVVDARFRDPDNNIDLVGPLQPTIVLDPSPPRIVSVTTNKLKSLYCHTSCSYTIGEEIYISVSFDRPVVVHGNEVSLAMDVGDDAENNLAAYVPSEPSAGNELVFLYVVGPGHSSDGQSLNYLCSESSLRLGTATEVKAAASIPTLDADLTLPTCPEHGLTGDELNPILIDTSDQPNVIGVSSTAADGVYSPGDTIDISVQFSRTVVVTGEPFLTLDVGVPPAGTAAYKDGSGTSALLFEYEVGLDHASLDLEYVDAQSLNLGHDGVKSGTIKQASTNPSVDANLNLPTTVGSLGANSDIKIDSRKPFISLISAAPGEYSTGDRVSIQVQFSRPVAIDGNPSLVLNTRITERTAEYESQLNDRTIEFSYAVQLGDDTESLDYWSDEELLPSSRMSVRLNGGSIKLKGANPVLDADLHINPSDGYLDGNKLAEVTEGVALFRDLKIGQRGKDFKIWFQSHVTSTGGELQVAEIVKIDTSVEYEVLGDLTDRDPGDRYGSAVSLHGGMLAVGAPGKLNPTPEIQVLTVFSEASMEENEVQIITTSVNRSEAVKSSQAFGTCADAGETIQGSFTLTYNVDGVYAFASPIEFDSDVSADQLKSVLEHELELVGLIATSKSTDPTCESHNSWTWGVTFLDSSEGVGVLETNGYSLTGDGAHISQSAPTSNVDMLGGSFRLVNPFNGLISREISYDASSNAVKEAIEEDLAILVLSVQAENMDSIPELGRRWTVIFSHHLAEHGRDTNVPQLETVSDGLLGKDSQVWTHTGFEGRGILSGSFALSFRGSGPSRFVPHDSSDGDITSALQSLDSINDVSVSNRRMFSDEVGKSGFSWAITFNSVNKLTEYGWLLDSRGAYDELPGSGNFPTLGVASRLIGWNAGYTVQSETGRGKEDTQAQWMVKQMGDDGSGSGLVDIFRNVRETWKREATVVAADYDSNDSFGASVSIANGYLLAGAPSKEVDGLPEQQTMTCNGPAIDGYFFVTFRGFESSAIPHDATLADIQYSVLGLYGGTDNIHSTPRLIFNSGSGGWDGISTGFCDGSDNAISITFLTPDGGGISTLEKRSGDLEEIGVNASNLIGASISVQEHRAGTVAPMGKDLNNSQPTGKQSGSAYLFESHLSCRYCEPIWTQIMKFTPMNGMDSPTDAAEFGGSSVFVTGTIPASDLAIIGSPGFFHGSGKVYIFHFVQGSWILLDSLSDENWNHQRSKGGRFGSAIDADSDTIIIGSPGHSNGKGAVYVFRRSDKGKPYLASQAIYGPDDLNDGDNFGHSIALHNNKAVFCAPHKTAAAMHLSMLPQQPRQAGACYVYSREDQPSAFGLDQQLTPSNILMGDRFGWSVAMTSNRIVVGQVEESKGKIGSPRPVQVIKTYCENPPCKNAAASKFRLRWIDTTSWTPFLSASTSANQMRDAIEVSLLSGAASVSRSVLPDENGGHTWRITFDVSIFRDVNQIPAIHCDAFVTSSLSCKTHTEHDIPRNVRGKAHLFDFDESTETWTEQSFLFSSAPQRQDLLATSVAIDGNFAVAGAPNRELLNVNSGAALIYDISFLDLNFPDGPYSLTEGDIVDINVERATFDQRQVLSLRTMDPNADDDWQHHINELFSLRSLDVVSYEKTPVELLTGNSAMGRSQYFGSYEKRSLFIRGLYDTQGINDYELLDFEGQFRRGENTITTSLKTNNDHILDAREKVTIQVNLRGMFASQLGKLKTDVHMSDGNDGQTSGTVKYQVLHGESNEEFGRMGVAVDIDRAAGMLVVGSDQTGGVGSVDIFKRISSGSWDFMVTLSPPIGEIKANMNFGQSVAINKPYGRDDVNVLIGAPGAAAAFVYAFSKNTNSWTLQSKLLASDATLSSEDRFGGQGAIALNEDMAFVGSSSMESVYVFRRSHDAGGGFVSWDSYSILRSSDFDFDIYGHGFSIKHMHRQGFGMALAASGRTLLVGAPHADYGNRGDANEREHFDTDGVHNKGLGKGKVYAFFSQPHVQIVSLQSDEQISAGSFTVAINHLGIEESSGQIAHDSAPDLFKVSLEEMMTIGEVNVEASEKIEDDSYEMRWRVSFISNFADDHPLLVPQWHEHGCDDCVNFKVSVLSVVEPFMTVTATHSHQSYIQEGEMQPRDVTSTDLFGASIALDGPQAIIGSMHSAAKTRTTWNFETGGLEGWSSTGTAFRHQPTYGDNSKFRAIYEGYGTTGSHTSGESQGSRLVGRYYVASYDRRPGIQDGNYQIPNQSFSLGSTQGDGPMGTLTSDPFIIRGKTISFLIGGGCNHLTAFVELLVDGYPSLRATGKCSERMTRAYWDVEMFRNRAGQIRIVDDGSDKWDHINVDDINFSWHMAGKCLGNNFGQCAEGGGTLPNQSASASEMQHYTGKEESPMSGAAYMFLYECDYMDLYDLSPSNTNCAWVEQERLVASDKREGNIFGISVDVDHEQGVAIVGSSHSPAYGFYQEPVSVHPHSNSTVKLPIPEDLEDMMKSGTTYSATGGNVRLIDYLSHNGQIAAKEASKFTEQAGTAYVFKRVPARYGPIGEISQKPFWRTTEHSKIAPPDVAARDNFGFSVALDGTTAVMGAVGRGSHAENGGGAFVYDMEWVRVKFSQVEYPVVEGEHTVKIFVERDLSWSDLRFSIAYSTSDLTAVGVDTIKYEECMNGHSSPHRDGCGDYEQSSGEVSFNPGEQHAYFTIRIVDDRCIERHMEYVQLNLHQIGGSPLRGEDFRSQLRIDDDDWPHHLLSMNCTGGIG